jgi:hypothetical protein
LIVDWFFEYCFLNLWPIWVADKLACKIYKKMWR